MVLADVHQHVVSNGMEVTSGAVDTTTSTVKVRGLLISLAKLAEMAERELETTTVQIMHHLAHQEEQAEPEAMAVTK